MKITFVSCAKRFATQKGPVDALSGIDLEVPEGEFLCLRGPSGSASAGSTSFPRAVGPRHQNFSALLSALPRRVGHFHRNNVALENFAIRS